MLLIILLVTDFCFWVVIGNQQTAWTPESENQIVLSGVRESLDGTRLYFVLVRFLIIQCSSSFFFLKIVKAKNKKSYFWEFWKIKWMKMKLLVFCTLGWFWNFPYSESMSHGPWVIVRSKLLFDWWSQSINPCWYRSKS